MPIDNSSILSRVLYAGPDMKAQGGIASVVQAYDLHFGPIAYLPTTSRFGKAASALVFAAAMLKLPFYRLRGYKILHAHGAVRGSFPRKRMLLKWGHMLGMRTVHHLHSGRVQEFCENMGLERARKKLSKTDAIVALSPFWGEFLRNQVGLTNVHVVHNIITLPEITVAPRPHSPMRLLFLGQIHHTKGIFDLLETFARYHDRLRGKVHLHIGGSGPGDEQMYKMIDDNALSDIVTTHGWVAGADKDRLLAECDAFILPSYCEGMPICILEAMSAKMPVIATPVGGVPEIVADGENGIIIPVADHEAMMRAIEHLLLNPKEARETGERNFGMISDYMPDKVKNELIELYKDIDNASEN